ncbi:MAG: aldose 1-epimerase family protein [Pirellulales bacterium]|nr:aldose 1-epimerase family protein [Pirellulales bacterium]
MSIRTWTLTDVDQDVYVDALQITPDHVDGAATGYSVTKRRLRGGLRDGVDVVEVDNGAFRFVVIPTRGMGLWRARLGKVGLGWSSPRRGQVHPGFVNLQEASGVGWLDGFDELLVRCGLESNGAEEFEANGALRYPMHGRIANIPAHRVEVTIDGDSGQITIGGEVDDARAFGNKLRLATVYTTTPGRPGVSITDTVTSISGRDAEMQLLYHCNLGVPLLEPGAKLLLPTSKVAPRGAVEAPYVQDWQTYGPEMPDAQGLCNYFQPLADAQGRSLAVLHNAAADQGVLLRFNINQLPCFTQWKNHEPVQDGYVTGLEPATNYPNRRSFEKEHGRVVPLKPGQSVRFDMELEALPDATTVQAASGEVAQLQQSITPEVLAQPDPQWAP